MKTKNHEENLLIKKTNKGFFNNYCFHFTNMTGLILNSLLLLLYKGQNKDYFPSI